MDAITKINISAQAASCVEDLLESIEKQGSAKPWLFIVEQNMEKLINKYERNKSRKRTRRA